MSENNSQKEKKKCKYVLYIPAALLAKPAFHTGYNDLGAFGMSVTDPMAAVVVFGQLQIEVAAFHLAAGVLHIVIGGPRSFGGRGNRRGDE